MIPLSILRSLKRLRKMHGFRQSDVAQYLKYRAASSYHRIESGEIQPTVEQFRQLCRLYNLSWEAILGPISELAESDRKPES